MISSLAKSSIKQYNITYKKWWAYHKGDLNSCYTALDKDVIDFLYKEFVKRGTYSTLNTYRSAISLIIPSIKDSTPLKRYLKGVFRLRPSFPRYTKTWNPDKVLEYLSKLFPLNSLTLELLSLKLITLVSLCTAHRLQTFQSIKIRNISNLGDRIEIIISDLLKTSAPKKEQPRLCLPFFDNNPELCVASTLLHYVEVTKPLRGNTENLFITYKKPFHATTTQSLSRWFKNVLKRSGTDTNTFTPYSTRHASTSAAFRSGVSIDTIRTTAGWTKHSAVFLNYYNKPIENPSEFARNIIS